MLYSDPKITFHYRIATAKNHNEFPFSLFARSFTGSMKIVQMLIEKGANVNAVNEDHNSALMYAALNGITLEIYSIIRDFIVEYCNKSILI